ncbi:NAD-dependent epimerase/dehydratase family protein [Sporolactobacillus spathodeae]|uniref:Nucleoside-diphosphate-sugar epimerase n=1 Tax=Sporolactobacillus spathodeae TaxID=1465502 RepID=A0ABS2QAC2_9BACL|nr:NAD(P)H-binding protein [Sporolactobacillus spathodeae]MBM7658395.1 nucleoside-diphosphate-sugar epimerase [Sporolactobacillus spathodeae]
MKLFMIGGTGLLGSEAAKELISRGHEVTSIALPPLPSGAVLPPKMKIEFGNYLEMTDEEIEAHFAGCEGFIFAAGVDERVEGPAPIYALFKKYNIDPVKRLLRLAKKAGIKHSVILGSYFAYFNRIWPEKELTKWHPYIRSRKDQEDVALSFADEGFDVAVLELPYIFGTQPGRKPVWMFLVESIRNMKWLTLYPRGGTAMVTVRQVGQAIAGAIERNRGGHCYPIGYDNMKWKELLNIAHKYLGCPNKKVVTIPDWLYALGGKKLMKEQKAKNIEGGLNMVKFTELQCSELFIDKSLGCEILGVQQDNIDRAIGDSIELCIDIIDHKVQALGMKGE